MQGTNAEQWASEGYARVSEYHAVLPWQSFTVDLEVGVERQLSAPDAAILALVAAGHGEPERIAGLMGLQDRRLVTMGLARLLQKAAIVRGDTGFETTEMGRALLVAGRSHDVERTTDTLHYDAVRARYDWVAQREVERILPGHVTLPFLEELKPVAVERALPVLQALVRERGVPSIDREDARAKVDRGRRELRALRVVGEAVHWRAVRVEVWKNEATAHERQLIYTGAAEDPDATRQYESLGKLPAGGR